MAGRSGGVPPKASPPPSNPEAGAENASHPPRGGRPPRVAPADPAPRADEPPAAPAKPGSKFTPKNQDKLAARNAAVLAEKEPVAGKRLCSRCKELKPRTQYRVKRKDTGQLHSICIPCRKEYGAERYLTSKNLAK